MEKKLKDYLHLYLGCKVWDDYDSDIKTLYSVTCDSVVYLLKNTQHKRTLIEIKPILRPLSDMTEEESVLYKTKKRLERATPVHQIMVSMPTAKSFMYLLSKHFDLFNLIEEGLAIDATKEAVK